MRVAREDRYAKICLAVLAVWWVAWGISPHYRNIWFAENILVFVGVPLAVYTHVRVGFSRPALTLLTIFFLLHTVGSHYTYSEVPLGEWMREKWGYQRNHFDRIVHFGFGFFLGPALREIFTRGMSVGRKAGFWLPLCVVMAASAFYEMLEWWFAIYMASETAGLAFVGAQGDVWDAQKDTALATFGAVLILLGASLDGEER